MTRGQSEPSEYVNELIKVKKHRGFTCDSDSGGVGRRPIGRQDGGALMAGGYFAEIEG